MINFFLLLHSLAYVGLFELLYAQQFPEEAELPKPYSASAVRERIRSRIKHLLEDRRKNLKKKSGASEDFLLQYQKDAVKLEVCTCHMQKRKETCSF